MTPASRTAHLLQTGWLVAVAMISVLLSACGKQEASPSPPAVPASSSAPPPASAPSPGTSPDEPGAARQPSRLTAYLYGKDQIGALYEIGRQWDKKLGLQQDCKSQYNIQPLNLFLLKGIEFPESQPHPVAGSWQHRFVFERCGKRMTYNAVFVARPGGKPEVQSRVPGNTNASMQQVSEALKIAAPTALTRLAKRGKNCQDAELVDTRLTHPPREAKEADRPAGHWEETWTFRGCDLDVEVPVIFTPDGKGGMKYAIKGAG